MAMVVSVIVIVLLAVIAALSAALSQCRGSSGCTAQLRRSVKAAAQAGLGAVAKDGVTMTMGVYIQGDTPADDVSAWACSDASRTSEPSYFFGSFTKPITNAMVVRALHELWSARIGGSRSKVGDFLSWYKTVTMGDLEPHFRGGFTETIGGRTMSLKDWLFSSQGIYTSRSRQGTSSRLRGGLGGVDASLCAAEPTCGCFSEHVAPDKFEAYFRKLRPYDLAMMRGGIPDTDTLGSDTVIQRADRTLPVGPVAFVSQWNGFLWSPGAHQSNLCMDDQNGFGSSHPFRAQLGSRTYTCSDYRFDGPAAPARTRARTRARPPVRQGRRGHLRAPTPPTVRLQGAGDVCNGYVPTSKPPAGATGYGLWYDLYGGGSEEGLESACCVAGGGVPSAGFMDSSTLGYPSGYSSSGITLLGTLLWLLADGPGGDWTTIDLNRRYLPPALRPLYSFAGTSGNGNARLFAPRPGGRGRYFSFDRMRRLRGVLASPQQLGGTYCSAMYQSTAELLEDWDASSGVMCGNGFGRPSEAAKLVYNILALGARTPVVGDRDLHRAHCRAFLRADLTPALQANVFRPPEGFLGTPTVPGVPPNWFMYYYMPYNSCVMYLMSQVSFTDSRTGKKVSVDVCGHLGATYGMQTFGFLIPAGTHSAVDRDMMVVCSQNVGSCGDQQQLTSAVNAFLAAL